ncbi:hypothetical protein AAGG29_26045, partial [Klebsiella pneumoniae]
PVENTGWLKCSGIRISYLALLLMDLVLSGFGSIEYSATLNYIIDDNRRNLTNETKEIYIRHDIHY